MRYSSITEYTVKDNDAECQRADSLRDDPEADQIPLYEPTAEDLEFERQERAKTNAIVDGLVAALYAPYRRK